MRCIACGKRLIRDKGYPTENAGNLCATCLIAYNIGFKDGLERGSLNNISSSIVAEKYSKLIERLGRIEDHVNVIYMRDRSRKRRD